MPNVDIEDEEQDRTLWLLAAGALCLAVAAVTFWVVVDADADDEAYRPAKDVLALFPESSPNLDGYSPTPTIESLTGPDTPLTATDASTWRSSVPVIHMTRTASAGPNEGFDPAAFGGRPPEGDDRTGCDVTNIVLRRDLANIHTAGLSRCKVRQGTLVDPFTGLEAKWVHGQDSPVGLVYVVPLEAAWQMGAARWDDQTRNAFVNDPLNLVVASLHDDAVRSGRPPGEWMPPDVSVGCAYATRYAAVSHRYDLPVTAADKKAMSASCEKGNTP